MCPQPQEHVAVRERDFSFGIDQWSAENDILEGYVEDAVNVDVIQDRIRKRQGYAAYAQAPVAITSMSYRASDDRISITFPLSVNLSQTPITPLILAGTVDLPSVSPGGPFSSTYTEIYWAGGEPQLTRFLPNTNGALSTETIEGASLGFEDINFAIRLTNRIPGGITNNETFDIDSLSINKTSFDISLSYRSYEDINAFVYYKALDIGEDTYLTTFTVPSSVGQEIYTHTVAVSTYNLPNANLIADLWLDNGTSWELVQDEEVSIAGDGTVVVSVRKDPAIAYTYKLTLTSVPALNSTYDTIDGNETKLLTINNAESPYLISSSYMQDGALLKQVFPDKVEYNELTNTHTLTFVNKSSTPHILYTFFNYGDIVANTVVVGTSPVNITSDYEFTSPQIVVYGLLNKDIYPLSGAGISNYIDSYKREGDDHLLTSVGGNLYKIKSKDEVSLPSLFCYMQARATDNVFIGPAFYLTGIGSPSRTAGYVSSDQTDNGHNLPCIAATYSAGKMIYRLNAGTYSVTGTPIQAGDVLSVNQLTHTKLEGDFIIDSITYGVDYIDISVTNPAIADSGYDNSNLGGYAGVFSDRIPVDTTKLLIPGDLLAGGNLTDLYSTIVSIPSDTEIIIDSIMEEVAVPSALRFTVQRVGQVVTLRNAQNESTVSTIVAGDVVFGDRYVKSVNPNADETISIEESNPGAAPEELKFNRVVLSTLSTAFFSPGDYIIVSKLGAFLIESIYDGTKFDLSEAPVDAATASLTLLGNTVNVDAETYFIDSTTTFFDVERRLYEVGSPIVTSTLVQNSKASYFPNSPTFGELPIHSVMVADNMYLANGYDPLMKYDGDNLYQASLPSFNPLLFARFVPDNAGGFGSYNQFSKTGGFVESASDNMITIVNSGTYKPTDVEKFSPGDYVSIVWSSGSTFAYVQKFSTLTGTYTPTPAPRSTLPIPSGADTIGYLYLDRAVPVSADTTVTVTKTFIYKYYYRLNAVDANRNIIASTVVGSDTTILQTDNGYVWHRLVQPPVWGIYDYRYIEIQLYRTGGNGSLFKRVVSIPATFNKNTPYIDFNDTLADDGLKDVDPTSVRLSGEIGKTFAGAPAAKYITSVNNSLLLANITSNPKLSIIIDDKTGLAAISDFNGTEFAFTNGTLSRSFVFSSTSVPATSIASVASTSFTLTKATHGLNKNDWIYVFQTSLTDDSKARAYLGFWQINDISGSDIIILNKNATADVPSAVPSYCKVGSGKIPVYLGSDDLSHGTSIANSNYPLIKLMYRLSMAVNASMRATDTTLTTEASFVPWLLATTTDRPGEIVFNTNNSVGFTLAYPTITNPTRYAVFANENEWASGNVGSLTIRYPSRLLVSYTNYPELFDNIYAVNPDNSDSVVDVNPADGQEITGLIPFFGETAFGAALKGQYTVVFKQNSIYLIDPSVKAAGGNPVQRLETNGIGCTSPRSIAVSKNAIFFASESGIYALRRDLSLDFVGKFLNRLWLEETQYSLLNTKCCGHHDPIGKKYMLSYPILDSNENNGIFAYAHSQEEKQELGAWTRYTNYPATGWCNLGSDEYFASTFSWLYKTRRDLTTYDFADEGAAIEATLLLRAKDFDNSGIRKQIRHIIAHYRPITSLTSVAIYVGVDLSETFASLDAFEIDKGVTTTSLNTLGSQKVHSIAHSLPTERGIYFQLKLVEGGLRQGIDFVGVDYLVLPLSHHGIPDAVSTKR